MPRVLRALSFGLLLAASCKDAATSYCDAKCACEGCEPSDRTRCVDEVKGQEKTSVDVGCGGDFDDYLDCSEAHAVCAPGKHPTLTDGDACGSEEARYDACLP